jgi:hypothetical protein
MKIGDLFLANKKYMSLFYGKQELKLKVEGEEYFKIFL